MVCIEVRQCRQLVQPHRETVHVVICAAKRAQSRQLREGRQTLDLVVADIKEIQTCEDGEAHWSLITCTVSLVPKLMGCHPFLGESTSLTLVSKWTLSSGCDASRNRHLEHGRRKKVKCAQIRVCEGDLGLTSPSWLLEMSRCLRL